ncbi:MAG TPA: phosphatase PAP2 family protein [Candidatus Aquilonibacter sp.]|nr:phosphatase PAP2 family protein [Candidatus Aquilonibacter sp.]
MPFEKGKSRPWRLPLKLVIGLIVILAAFAVDDSVTGFFQLHTKGWAWTAASLLSKYGDWPPLLAAGLVGVLILHLLRRFEASRLLLLVVIAGMLTGLSATVIRSVTGRTRPDAEAPQGFYGVRRNSQWIIGKYEFGSFPSGHTATVAGLAVAAWLVNRRFGAAAAIFGAAVAWSRLALHCHHFSDVVASVVLGIFLSPWIFRFWEIKTKDRWPRGG